MSEFPLHRSPQFFPLGVYFQQGTFLQDKMERISYAHQDNYYILGFIIKGIVCVHIDFEERCFSQGEILIIQPGQVHHFVSAENAEGVFLITDNNLMEETSKEIFDNILLSASSIKLDETRIQELLQIGELLEHRQNATEDHPNKTIIKKLAELFIGILAEFLRELCLQQTKHSKRYTELYSEFRKLLMLNITRNRQPTFYASLLHISPVYLNEVIKSITGKNTNTYINDEIILRAKRLLVHSPLSIKEISYQLGLADYAYFSRLFSKGTGYSPSTFRKKNIE